MTFVRREIRSLGAVWNPTIYWYARAVRAMQAKPITNRTSWRFLGAIHGFHPTVWQQFGYIAAGTALPSAAIQQRFWNQCQHQSWHFLPWHRGYLYAFEQNVRATVVSLGGPADWALPYWNYSSSTISNARRLPDAFAVPTMPDGSPNPLFVPRRFGRGTFPIVLSAESVQLSSLQNALFVGGTNSVPPGFGGPITGFNHGGTFANGGIESQPHNPIHGAIGGSRPGTNPNMWQNWGIMSMPETAALDPIFWLHHANIDRLWSFWLNMPWSFHFNPVDPAWLNGPPQQFVMPLSNGTDWVFRPGGVTNTFALPLDYGYDAAGTASAALVEPGPEGAGPEGSGSPSPQEGAMTAQGEAEMIGASKGKISVNGGGDAALKIDAEGGARVMASFAAANALTEGAPAADRIYLKLEGVRGTSDAAVFRVYVDLPKDARPSQHPERFAGMVSLFGVSAASDPDGKHGGNGIDQVFDVTDIVSGLELRGGSLDKLDVRFVPDSPLEAKAEFTVDRISVFRLGA